MYRFAWIFLFAGLCFVCDASAQVPELQKISVNGVEINYVERGQGEPLILLHGGLFDHRSWEPQFEEFAQKYRVISYSRRYNYPNRNTIVPDYRPAVTDAQDLKALMIKLGLKKAHLVGLSYGAFVGLHFAVENPKMVASMVLAEPPAHQLIRDLPGGEAMYQDFMDALAPMVAAFRDGDDRRAIVAFNQNMGRDFEKLPAAAATASLQNARALRAINLSSDPFPVVSKRALGKLRIPTMIIKSERADALHGRVADEIARLIPSAKLIVVPNAGHASPRDNPRFFNTAVVEFLDSIRARSLAQ